MKKLTSVVYTAFSYCIVFVLTSTEVIPESPDLSGNSYSWKNGSWSACINIKRCGMGQRTRKVWCQDSTGLIYPDSNCVSLEKPPTTKTCFRVCEKHKHDLRWSVGEWSPCIPVKRIPSSTPCRETSIAGVARRTVNCIYKRMQRIVASEACEYFWDRPDSEMPCSLDCPQDCIVRKRNVSCIPPGCKANGQWMEEVTDVIIAPDRDGMPCSSIDHRPVCSPDLLPGLCKNSDNANKRYLLKISEWSPCQVADNQNANRISFMDEEIQIALHPLIGLSWRNVTCITEDGEITDISFCNAAGVPALVRRCVVPVHCAVSPWSEWNVTIEGCISSDGKVHPETRIRTRRLLQMPVGTGAEPCPPLFEQRMVTIGLPRCYKYQWYPLEWSACEIRLHNERGETKVVVPTCGSGFQYRNLTCLRTMYMVPVNETMCKEPRPVTIQRCKVPCKRDCQVSQWSRWGLCMPFNNTDFLQKVDSGYRRRDRSVIVSPSNGGKQCPHLQELDECSEIEIFDWQYGSWSNCSILDPQAVCGPGERTRDFTCVNYDGAPMSDFMCHHHKYLEVPSESCRVPCPNDCIMTEWSDWSVCSQRCISSDGHGIQIRNRSVLAIAGEGGKECPKKRRNDRKTCNTYSCVPYKWETSEWGPCILSDRHGEISYGTGFQERQIRCMKGGKEVKSTKMCQYLSIPVTKRECYIPKPVDCIMSNFSEWTSCEDDCDGVQYRHRIVLQTPQNGGKPCPEAFLEGRPCSSALDCFEPSNKSQPYMKVWNIDYEEMRVSTYEWNTGKWSECQIPVETQQCGMGFQVRNVSCIDSKTALIVEPHLCLTAVEDPVAVPSAVRSCEITCSPRCVLTTWCSWTECVYGYKSKRSRGRELVDASESNTKCLQHKLSETEDCPVFPPVQTEISNAAHWLSCIVDEANMTLVAVNGHIVRHACGEGYRYKAGVQMNSKLGVGPGLEKDFCWVDCPIDCQMSEWSEWSTCDVPCGKGFRERRRQVIVPANKLGRPCLGTVDKMEIQRDVCYIACSDFKWSVEGWSHCELDDNESSGCGNGTRYRTVKCWDKRAEQEVEEIKCDPLHKPTSVERCRIHCPGECVLSSWSLWKECSEPCSSDNFQEMHRTIMRHPNSTADSCPSLISRTPCILNKTCHHYTYKMGPWGSCILPEGALCGEGVQKRPLLCLRSDGRQVDAIQCEKSHKPMSMKEPVSKPCYVDCPIDCVMSEWSAWNDSECSACGSPGVMIRKRYVLQLPTDSGQPCPSEVKQRKPCPFIPCYHWKYSDWSTCDLEGADCGYGVRRRVVECIRYDGLQVDKMYCLTINATFPKRDWLDPSWLALAHEESQEEQICHVPCPGDCIMTEWTEWSHCQKNCRIGQTFGYQTSSRKILYPPRQTSGSCPVQLWRTRPCWADDCGFFRWKVKNDSLICVGRDSVAVEGGCTSEPRPCLKNCEELGGRCDPSTGLCHCLDAKGHVVSSPSSDYSERCAVMSRGPHPPANHSAPTAEIRLKYYPDDSQVSFWMYAMISIGTAFVIFVAVTVYLMCRSSLRQRSVSVERQPSLRRRTNMIKQTRNHSPLEDAAINSNSCSL